MSRYAINPVRRLEGETVVPGDKSITHRAAIFSSVGRGTCDLLNPSPADDVGRTVEALAALGVPITELNLKVEGTKPSTSPPTFHLLVNGSGWSGIHQPKDVLDCGNSGTTMRTLLGILAGRPLSATLDGDQSLRRRPMRRVTDPLRRMGATIHGQADGNHAPLTVSGAALTGCHHDLPVASAQVKTAILLAGLQAAGETSVAEPGPSRDHTERLLRYLGVEVAEISNRLSVKSTDIQNASVLDIPGDLSSAAFFLVAAAILPGSDVTIAEVGTNPTRSGILDLLVAFGAKVEVSGEREVCGEPRASVRVRPGDRRALTVDGSLVPRCVDELPLVAVLGAFADGETVVTGAAELRVKESDRIAAITDGLTAMGVGIRPLPDGFVVRGGRPLRGAEVDSKGDHRIAMGLAVAALAAAEPTGVSGWEAVSVSYPGFGRDLARIAVERS